MKNLIAIILLFFSAFVFGQGAGITQRNGVPNFTPTNQQSNFYLDQTTKVLYEYCPACTGNTNGWIVYSQRIDRIAGTTAPVYTPNSFDAKIVVNGSGSIYTWNGTTWIGIGKVTFYPYATGGKTIFKLLEGDYKSNPSAAPSTAEIGEFAVKPDTDNPGITVEPEFINSSSIVAKIGLDSNYVKNLTKAKLAINGNTLSIIGSNSIQLPSSNSWTTGGNTLSGLEVLGSNSPNYGLRIKANNLEVGRFYSDVANRYFLADNGKPFILQHLNGSNGGNDMYIQAGNTTTSGGDLYLQSGVKGTSGGGASSIFLNTGNGSGMVQAMRVFNGNVGIGLNGDIPTQNLDIGGNIRIRGGSPGQGKVLTSDANGVGTWQTPTTPTVPTKQVWFSSTDAFALAQGFDFFTQRNFELENGLYRINFTGSSVNQVEFISGSNSVNQSSFPLQLVVTNNSVVIKYKIESLGGSFVYRNINVTFTKIN